LAGEMVSGENRKLGFYEVLKTLYKYSEGQIGKVYVKFLDPINMQDYMEK
jgi:glycerol-3-phosphate O-acyltransferase